METKPFKPFKSDNFDVLWVVLSDDSYLPGGLFPPKDVKISLELKEINEPLFNIRTGVKAPYLMRKTGRAWCDPKPSWQGLDSGEQGGFPGLMLKKWHHLLVSLGIREAIF
ncbi:MAG: hypothetical protein CM15mP103_03900 [Gammaproteobacteria bacterium]|nr:MAG: hypothetical protein CM15mP103_03900 [Gammaproteobacteria bacterium]